MREVKRNNLVGINRIGEGYELVTYSNNSSRVMISYWRNLQACMQMADELEEQHFYSSIFYRGHILIVTRNKKI